MKFVTLLSALVMLLLFHPASRSMAQQPLAHITSIQERALAAVACAKPLSLDYQRNLSCPVCPRGSDFADYPGSGWRIGTALFGHFTAANRTEALLNIGGCESYVSGEVGDLLLRKQDGKWKTIRYIQGGIVNDRCLKLKWPDRRDVVLCNNLREHRGMQMESAELIEIAPEPPKIYTPQAQSTGTLFAITNTLNGDCRSGEFIQPSPYIKAPRLLRDAKTGRQNVEIIVSSSSEHPVAGKRRYRLLFLNQGDRLQAAPSNANIVLKGTNVNAITVRPQQL